MAKFDLYEKPGLAQPHVRAAVRAAQPINLLFAGGVSLWFLVVFFVGYLVLGG